jgi:alkanesulfonate monooxygenase SsuD/methylene tetrahydromethanopterin reductase-like flavin-dependent oxidoreductase (luciferase family)
MTKIGCVFPPTYPPERLRDVVRIADETGLHQLWLWEDCFKEAGISTATAALAWSDRVRVGVGVLPVPLRNVALTAMEVAGMARMFPDRAIIGVGHGVLDWMAQVGARVASPMTLLREYTTALRALLHGERLTVDGRYVHLTDVALDWSPAVPPPIMSAATGPKTIRLTGEVADGTILTGDTTPALVRDAVTLIGSVKPAGREHEVVVYVPMAYGPDAAERLAAENAEWRPGGDGPYGVAGEPDEIVDGLRRFVDAGATTVVLQPLAKEPDPENFVRFVAQHIQPAMITR